uniref:diguanylate cyclase domain-containing protein n=2 Tax=Vibrionaceae TaxID=641 RepID=UPI000CE36608
MFKFLSLGMCKIILSITILITLSINIYTVDRINEINEKFSSRQNEATWFVFQLVKEYSNFLMMSKVDNIDYRKLWISYDITWSRFDILLNSNESSNFIKSANFKEHFRTEFDNFKRLESSLSLLKRNEITQDVFHKKVDITYHNLVQFINEKFRLQSPVIEENTLALSKLILIHKVSSMILVVCFIFVILSFYADFSVKKSLSTNDHLTGFRNRSSLMNFLKNDNHNVDNYDLYIVKIRNLMDVNQKYGAEYGDLVIRSAADSLSPLIPKESFSFRSSGSQFMFFVPKKKSDGKKIQEAINNVLDNYIPVGNLEIIIDSIVRYKNDINNQDMMEYISN